MNYFKELKNKWNQLSDDVVLESGLIILKGTGHTRKVAYNTQVHEGRATANYYTAATCLGVISESTQIEILNALSNLQERRSDNRFYGCSRWYSEEDDVEDTNGGFFITMPLLELYMLNKESLPESNIKILKEMFSYSLIWFKRECAHPSNYYPNKVLSDGAALSALAYCLEDKAAKQIALDFICQWDEYTLRRGWGWGENISPTYHEIILDALSVMLHVLHEWKDPLEENILKHYKTIIEAAAYHRENEYIPAIRSYNFEGIPLRKNTTSLFKAGLIDRLDEQINEVQASKLSLCGLVITALLYGSNRQRPSPQTDAVRIEHVFDDAFSYTWKGKNIHLGSLNHYPVMQNCYQHPDWGLGWQSMPISFLVKGKHTGYIRFEVNDGEHLRAHPAYNYHDAYLHSGLFKENYLPAVRSNCSQKDNILIATRTIEKLHNQASMIEDAWIIHNFHGRVEKVEDWVCLIYNNCSLAVLSLGGFTSNEKDIGCHNIEIQHEDNTLKLRKALYEGELTLLDSQRLECQWVVIAYDDISDKNKLAQELKRYTISDEYLSDSAQPRDGGWLEKIWEARATKIYRDNKLILEHNFDPFSGIRN